MTKEVVDEELPDLTENQHGFKADLLKGESARQAYKNNYSTDGWSDNMIDVEASRLRNNPKLALWLNTVRQQQRIEDKVTLEGHISELARLKELSLAGGNYGAAINAEVSRGKATGLYIERHEDMTPTQDTDIIEDIRSLLGDDFAEAAAKRLGLQ